MNIMHKMLSGMSIIESVKVCLSRVTERGMTHIVTKRDCLDKIKI